MGISVTVFCGRCHSIVQGAEDGDFTAGFYRTSPSSVWHKYAREGEMILCDPCMHADPGYRADYSAIERLD